MAFTKVLPSGISSTATVVFDSINTVGVITASQIIATTGTFTGNVSVAGTITYEDVTNVDSVGVITARDTINAQRSVTVGAGLSVVGVSTFTNGPVLIGSGTSTGTASQPLQVTGGAYVSGSVGIGTTNPLTIFDARGVITAGSTNSVYGSEILRGYYNSGALSVFGSEASSGSPVIGYAVKPSTSGVGSFFSSTSVNIARGAYVVGNSEHRWYTGGTQTVAENSPVTMSEVMRINGLYLGIGTISPQSNLHVQGTGQFAADSSSSATITAAIYADTPLQTVSAFFGKITSASGLTGNQYSTAIRFNGSNVNWGDIAYYPNQGGQGHFRFSLAGNSVNTTPDATVGVGNLYAANNIGIGTINPYGKTHIEINAAAGSGSGNACAIWLKNANQTANNSATIFAGNDSSAACAAINFVHANYSNNQGFITFDTRENALTYNSSAMKIDAYGRVTKPYQPFVAGGSGGGSISGNNNHVWGTSGNVWSNVGNHWNASTGRFTAPVDGVYYVSAGIRYSSISVTPSYIYIWFAASYQTASGQPILLWSPGTESGGTYRPRFLTSLMYMRANDYVEPRLYVTSGTIAIDGGSTAQSDCFLNIYLLG